VITPAESLTLWGAIALGNPARAFWSVALAPVIANVAANPPDPARYAKVMAEIKATYKAKPVPPPTYMRAHRPPAGGARW
jgi:hypothetical protein